MKILFIGGTGVISSACSQLCVEKGYELYVLNRGVTSRPLPDGVTVLKGDIHNREQVKDLIKDLTFDVVVDWIAYTPDHIHNDFLLFRDKTSQFIFISTASAYQKSPKSLPVKETDPLENPFWDYSYQKILCEKHLLDIYIDYKFPVTIVRPSHTYDKTKIPLHGGYTALDRLLKGKQIIIHGDGTSLWTLTHHRDFAKGFVGLLGKSEAIGEAYHITSDELLTWNHICEIIAEAACVKPKIIHIPSDFIARFDKEWGDGLLGDKAHCAIFDNSKIKQINPDFEATIPFTEGAKEIVAWYLQDESRRVINAEKDKTMDHIISTYELI